MILACPACRTRYLVDEQDLNRPAGRTVRCASCGHTWRQPQPLVIRDREPTVGTAGPRIEPGLEVPPRPRPPLPVPAAQRRRPRRRAVGWVVLGVVVVLLGPLLVAIFARGEIMATWPATAPIYAAAGLPAPAPPGFGLELGKVVPTRTAEGVVIEGDITNTGSTGREVPRLRVALRTPDEKEAQFKIIDPPTARLGPSETSHFKTVFEHPDEAATGVVVTFAPR